MRITKRTITEAEFLKLKKKEPFASYRQDSKAINFGFIFGLSYMMFSSNELEASWSPERIESLIKEKELEDDVASMQEKWKDRDVDPKLFPYYAVANYMRNKFFEAYPGLMKRIKRNEQIGRDHGYIRSFHGGIRRVPLMALCYDDKDKLRKHEDRKEYSEWKNIMANTTIQTDESVHMNSCISDLDNPSILETGAVHDSAEMYVEREHLVTILLELKAHFERIDPDWQGKMIWPSDITVVDFNKGGHYYKHGQDADKYLKEL